MARDERVETAKNEEADRKADALATAFTAPRPSVEERMAAGKALRERVPRASHGSFERLPRVDPLAILAAQAATRLGTLVPVRHARMLQSPFAFLRGSAAVMAADLAASPSTGLQVQACGDMHVANFGVFASAERQLVFAINDFDETRPGPWEWDVKRLAASAFVAMQHLGGDKSEREAAARAAVESYRSRMRRYAGMGQLEVWYDMIHGDRLIESLPPALRSAAGLVLEKARKRTHMQVLDKLTDLVDERHRIIEQHPFIVRSAFTSMGRPVEQAIGHCLAHYLDSLAPERRLLLSRYRVVDAVQKVVGVGSVGTRCWVVLMQGRDEDDPLFLQFKEAQPSVLEACLADAPLPDAPANHGERVVRGQRLIQGSPDIFLGWGEIDGVHFYIRQLRDMKGSIDLEPGETTPTGFIEYSRLCGWALALAHAKSGDAAMIGGYLGKSDVFDDALVDYAAAYAAQTRADHERFAQAARDGLIDVAG